MKENSWGRGYVDKYITKWEHNGTVGYRVFINRHDLKVNERFETLEKAIVFRDESLRLCELSRLEKVKNDLDILEWPYNFISVLEFNVENVIEHFEERYDALYEKGTITPREKDILDKKYKDVKTLEEVGNEIGVTKERVRQIISKAVRKLRHRQSFFECGDYEHPEKVAKEKVKQLIEEQKQRWTYESAKKFIEEYESTHQQELNSELLIEELDLSVRSCNCLRRAGIKTVEELANKHIRDMYKIKNLGRKSLKEVVIAMNNLGFEIKGQEEFGVWVNPSKKDRDTRHKGWWER